MSTLESLDDFRISENAAKRIASLAAQEGGRPMLRISVSGGGCSGFQYGFDFDGTVNDDDRVFERADARVVIDETSLELLKGSEIDFVEDLMGAYFKVENPNASSSCGCGSSFAI
ncbi:iron-sulfur cluster insertion protein [Tistlia consotensis]|uniref:Iron-sulfur cluster insertion protein n=1 Tax=Tistlia consotensis USBA 355 TaxID=560819 RepID=A0A1Y6BJK8_9PROT|nr:iron-sulfur cluster insertion protein ErpA [Tistlia consotensis]SMF14239.1 iron-sulfur cluster insertion protein [Tistlia consotensis USBA 355]SNR49662.1 iron-sulfur cluster insertion protein [Tistlia consotensis]